MSFSLRVALLFVLLTCNCAGYIPAQATTKRLVFTYIDVDHTDPSLVASIMNAPNIDGVHLGFRWKVAESQKGHFDWRNLDTVIRDAAKHRKMVSIDFAGSPKTPDWLATEKVQFYTTASLSRSFVIDPVPWDATYLAFYKKFLAAASAHLKQLNMTPYVFAVGMAAPGQAITLVGCRHNKLGSVAYDRNKYLAACEQMVDAYHLYFPTARQLITAPQINMICTPDEDKAFYQELMNYALGKYGQSCWILTNDLKYNGSANYEAMRSCGSRTGLAFQLAGASQGSGEKGIGGDFPSNFQQAIEYGIKNGAVYFEVSGADAVNADPTVKATINAIHH